MFYYTSLRDLKPCFLKYHYRNTYRLLVVVVTAVVVTSFLSILDLDVVGVVGAVVVVVVVGKKLLLVYVMLKRQVYIGTKVWQKAPFNLKQIN
jgi:hypothetical protein